MQGIYTYIPQTNYVPREYSVAAIVLLLHMVHTPLAPELNISSSSSSSSSSYYYYYYYYSVSKNLLLNKKFSLR
jgi:hypothetical protein